MNFIQDMLEQHVEKLMNDSKKLKDVKEWAEGVRYILDNFGPDDTTDGIDSIGVGRFRDLEDILKSI